MPEQVPENEPTVSPSDVIDGEFDPDEFLGNSWQVFGDIGHSSTTKYFADLRKNPRGNPSEPYELYSKEGSEGKWVFRQSLRYVPRTRTLEGHSRGIQRSISLWDHHLPSRPRDCIFAVRSKIKDEVLSADALCPWETDSEDPATWGAEDG